MVRTIADRDREPPRSLSATTQGVMKRAWSDKLTAHHESGDMR